MRKIYMAPMEGVTTRTYRDTFRRFYRGVDRFYTPFLAATGSHHFKKREMKEFLPYDDMLVPQVLTADPEDFLWAVRFLQEQGYKEVDLNLGCPYPTVFTKGKGSGMLADTERLDRFFDRIFREQDLPAISVKTRIGVREEAEAEQVTRVLAAYPFAGVTIHPRLREDLYKGAPRMETYRRMLEQLKVPVCYNGDICTAEDAFRILNEYSATAALMMGRGLLADPALAERIRGDEPKAGADEVRLKKFLDALWDAYSETLYGERDVLFKMKELWSYLGRRYEEQERALLDIKKAKHKSDYEEAVGRILGR